MRVFIDSNPQWSGGYLAHLKGILTGGYIPDDIEIILYGTSKLRNAIGSMDDNVKYIIDDSLPQDPIKMTLWRVLKLPKIIRHYAPQVHFSTSGHLKIHLKNTKQVVMSRNLQPHLKRERERFPLFSYERMRLESLHRIYMSSFRRADGVIFLTEYVREVLLAQGLQLKKSIVIPHGISDIFRRMPEKRPLPDQPTILYVSDIDIYKFQWQVARAVALLRKETDLDLQLHLVGNCSSSGMSLLTLTLRELGNPGWIKITGKVPYNDVHRVYNSGNIFVYSSMVEAFSNILLEAMASGLPIAYSNRKPMTDVLGNDGVLFEPEEPQSIASAILRLLEDDDLRYRCAINAYNIALAYSWERTAKETYQYVRDAVHS